MNDVKRLMSDNETDSVEYKATTGQLERGMETLCAFLNGSGGSVLFGITDKGQINGQEVADSTKRNIAEAINRIEPTAEVQIIYIPLPDNAKKIIVLHVEDARLNRPFCYKGRAYVRVESMTTVMSQATYEKLLLQRDGGKYRWEQFEYRPGSDQVPTRLRPGACTPKNARGQGTFDKRTDGGIGIKPPSYIQVKLSASGFE